MFVMMNGARLGVAVQGLASLRSRLSERRRLRQGAPAGALSERRRPSPNKPADPLLVHPDVRRMLLEIRSFNEAARALLVWIALAQDEARHAPDADRRADGRRSARPADAGAQGVFTDMGFANAVKAQQVLGGHGYIGEWGMEQFVRDARITMIYEGANGVQALDLVGRKLPQGRRARDHGALRRDLGFLAADKDDAALAPYLRARQSRARAFAAGDDVADAERHGQSRQRRRRVERLYAPASG